MSCKTYFWTLICDCCLRPLLKMPYKFGSTTVCRWRELRFLIAVKWNSSASQARVWIRGQAKSESSWDARTTNTLIKECTESDRKRQRAGARKRKRTNIEESWTMSEGSGCWQDGKEDQWKNSTWKGRPGKSQDTETERRKTRAVEDLERKGWKQLAQNANQSQSICFARPVWQLQGKPVNDSPLWKAIAHKFCSNIFWTLGKARYMLY